MDNLHIFLGATVADAATRPLHWVYDPKKLKKYIKGKKEIVFLKKNRSPFYNIKTGKVSGYNDIGQVMFQTLISSKKKSEIFRNFKKNIIKHFGPGSNYWKNLKLRKRSYLAHFNTGIQLWKKNKFFGSGLKSFKVNSTFGRNLTKNVHPHNYFIEILLDTGLIGILIIYSLIFIGIKNFIKNYHNNFYLGSKKIYLPFFLIIFFEFFPFRSSGSFFTTGNSAYIFFLLPFFLNSCKLEELSKSFNIR